MAFTTKLFVFGWLKEGFHTYSYCLGIMTTERDPFPFMATKCPMVAVTPQMGNTKLCDQTSRQNIWDFLSIAYPINLNARSVLPSCRQSMCATQLFGQRRTSIQSHGSCQLTMIWLGYFLNFRVVRLQQLISSPGE